MTFAEFVAVAPKSVIKALTARVAERQADMGMAVDPEMVLASPRADFILGDDPRLGGRGGGKGAFRAIVEIGRLNQEWFTYNPKYKGWV